MELSGWRWLSEPTTYDVSDDSATIHVEPDTDFWRITHYGFVRHSGHLLATEADGDFALQARVSGRYAAQYDQAGLMVLADEQEWVKAGVELVDGRRNLSAVVTHGTSDWSRADLPDEVDELHLRIDRVGAALHVLWSPDGTSWHEMRLASFRTGRVVAGVMAAAPQGPGFPVEFSAIRMEAR